MLLDGVVPLVRNITTPSAKPHLNNSPEAKRLSTAFLNEIINYYSDKKYSHQHHHPQADAHSSECNCSRICIQRTEHSQVVIQHNCASKRFTISANYIALHKRKAKDGSV